MFTFYLSEANTHTCTAHTCSIKNTHSYIKNIFKILEKKNMKINKDMFKILFKKNENQNEMEKAFLAEC